MLFCPWLIETMEDIKIIKVDETSSTNDLMREYSGEEGLIMTVGVATFQSAGRGQGENKWESERGKNLTFSIKVYPVGVPVVRQYVMLEAESLAIRDAVAEYVDGVTIKWPNDIYWRDKKISGTLSECTISGSHVGSCILGTGININQRKFVGDAPNPVSLAQILGRDVDSDKVLDVLLRRFEIYLSMVNEGRYDEIASLYSASLYRRSGRYSYSDAGGDFMAELECIEPDGHLVLRRDDGSLSRYAFKEVKYVI